MPEPIDRTEAQMIELLTLLKPHVHQAAQDLAGTPLTADDMAEAFEWSGPAVMIAWCMRLSSFKGRSKNVVITATDLDDAMLPHGTSDDTLIGLSGGMADGPFIRATLRLLKKAMPADAILPAPMVEMLRDDDIEVR